MHIFKKGKQHGIFLFLMALIGKITNDLHDFSKRFPGYAIIAFGKTFHRIFKTTAILSM